MQPHILLLICSFFLQGQMVAQPIVSGFKRFGRAEAVPNSSNNKLFESSDHFLWLSTESGLYRFDGYQFSPYFSKSKDPTSLSSNVLSDIEEDRLGRLWVGTFGRGVNQLNAATGQWKQYVHPTKDDNPFYWVFDLFKDYKGRLWMGTNGRGLLLYDDQKDSFRQFLPDPLKNKNGTVRFENEVRGITADTQEPAILWLACTDGLYRFDTNTESFTCFRNIKKGRAEWINNSFHSVYMQDASNIWLGAWGGGLIHFNTKLQTFTNYLIYPKEYAQQNFAQNIVSSIAYCSDSSLYVSTADAGLFEFNHRRHIFISLSDHEAVDGKKGSKEFRSITHTSDGSTWICSPEYIFQKHPVYERLSSFQSFYQPKDKFVYRPSLSGVLYRKESRQYWMSCNAGFGVYVYDSNFRYLQSIPIEGSATDKQFRDIVEDAAGTIWLLSLDAPYLYYYDPKVLQFLKAASRFKDPAFIQSGLKEMAIDGKGNVWFSNKDQLLKWDPLKKQLQNFSVNSTDSNHIKWQWAKLRIDPNNDPWLSTNLGLYHFNNSNASWQHLYAVQNDPQSLANTSVNSIAFNKKGQCWIAPMDEGLQLYDPSTHQFLQHYIQSEGFIAQRVNDVVTDSNDDLWTVTNNGLARYDVQQDRWYRFNQEDGLSTDNLYQPLFAMPDGSMILSVEEGFVYWNIHRLPLNRQKPLVYFNRFISGGNQLAVQQHLIQLPSSANELTIEFSAIATVMGNRTQFYYKILPLQKEWIVTTQRSISLAGLASGEYQLLLKAVNSDGVDSDIASLTISVAYPFWKKGWFILLSIIGVSTLLYLVYQNRVRQLLKMQQMRNTISRDLHDEIGSSVSSVNMLAMVAKKQLGEEHPISPLLTQIGQSAQNAGESINEIIWSINPQNDSLERIVLRMKELASEMLEYNGINYQLDFDKQFSQHAIPMEDRRHLFLIFKEALNNMIKYAHCKNALLSMHIQAHELLMTIEDDGVGFDLQHYTAGNGLLNMQQRAKENKGELLLTTAPGKGCKILLRWPLK